MKPRLALHDPDVELWEGDSLAVLRSMPDASVDAIVTSPPYADLRGGAAPERYAEWIAPVLEELRRVLSPTGGFLLNLGRVFRGGEESTYHEETMLLARRLGWLRIDTVVWHKPNALPLSHPRYLHNQHEYVYWLALRPDAYRGYTIETRRPHTDSTIARVRRAFTYDRKGDERYAKRGRRHPLNPDGARPASVVSYSVGKVKGVRHSAPMSLDLAHHLVALACPPGGLVLDPFAGSGTTLLAAVNSGRTAVGIDHDANAVREAVERLSSQLAMPVAAAQARREEGRDGDGGSESLASAPIPAPAPFSRDRESGSDFSGVSA
jgi:site-specific DNA-methyltransferase (adenine-specific)